MGAPPRERCRVIAGVVALVFSTLQPKTCGARTTLIVGQSLTSASPDYTGLLTSQQLNATYAVIATARLHPFRVYRMALDPTI